MEPIGIRELRQNASKWLRRVEAGESFEVTDRGRAVAQLIPVSRGDSALDRLVAAGVLRAPTVERPTLRRSVLRSGPTASEALDDLRRESS